ncbi:2-C-methyl-D-erythritol 2,4-cyclodiphosphate synthase [Paenibacillus sp. FSL K6-4396]|uniref:2-C-methyl-D-erythritol 2,4-cyclodiphosphate synthase n=1 Tax=unclassified Paenibacillus TaxID=185978 RepID=UPI001783C03B|nr:2-C-methyl-D-erythritol 2,4-cyclodiphosphate synthase [Paenibacillus sp. CFBP 13594]MBD8839095.1 2-C-methyl-D-erythritol 2,4-cyclodiphosphate synthase [Paenibacillus sp. CFBP 13594]
MKIGIGQDSHRFDPNGTKELILGGVEVDSDKSFFTNSDGDVVLHALTNAISSITCVNILGKIADEMCLERGILNSAEYVKEALKYLNGLKISNVSFSIECSTPKISPIIADMRNSIANLLDIEANCVGITATSGEELTEFGKGKGIQVFCTVCAI